jgi:hypothetical protein
MNTDGYCRFLADTIVLLHQKTVGSLLLESDRNTESSRFFIQCAIQSNGIENDDYQVQNAAANQIGLGRMLTESDIKQ